MPIVCVRHAALQDAEDIARLNRDFLGYSYSAATTYSQLAPLLNSPAHCILVAEINGNLAGYIHAADYSLLYQPPLKNIMGLAVDAAYRRMQVGQQLLHAVEEWALQTGAAGIRLTSGSPRTDAHEFYNACGYTKSKESFNFIKLFIPN